MDVAVDSFTLMGVVESLQLSAKGLIIERNGDLFREEHFDTTSVAAQDKLELIHFMGGGA